MPVAASAAAAALSAIRVMDGGVPATDGVSADAWAAALGAGAGAPLLEKGEKASAAAASAASKASLPTASPAAPGAETAAAAASAGVKTRGSRLTGVG